MYQTKDINIFIGQERENKNNVKVVPFVFNKNKDKIKSLTDNTIHTIPKNALFYVLLEKQYNVEMEELFALNALFNPEITTITHEELTILTSIIKDFYKKHQKMFTINSDKINEEYRNF